MPYGFIKSSLEIMELILYILARVDGPIDIGQLADLTLCDDGIDYFQFSDSLGKLESTEHVIRDENEGISITEKGRANGETTESELPYSVRKRCDKRVAELNRKIQRERLVRSDIITRSDGSGYTVRLILDDEVGNVMTLEMMAPDPVTAEQMSARFKAQPEKLYNIVLAHLLEE